MGTIPILLQPQSAMQHSLAGNRATYSGGGRLPSRPAMGQEVGLHIEQCRSHEDGILVGFKPTGYRFFHDCHLLLEIIHARLRNANSASICPIRTSPRLRRRHTVVSDLTPKFTAVQLLQHRLHLPGQIEDVARCDNVNMSASSSSASNHARKADGRTCG